MEIALPRRRGEESTIRLAPAPESVLAFERFVQDIPFLSHKERARVKLAGDEIIDNIMRHSPPLDNKPIITRIARRGGAVFLFFFFKASTPTAFADFASGYRDAVPLFDPDRRRWRGMGLRMCRNLAQKLSVKHGSLMDRIILSFPRES